MTIGARKLDDNSHYEQLLLLTYRGDGWVEGESYPLVVYENGVINSTFGFRLFENDGDAVIQSYRPLESEPSGFTITEVDPAENRLRAAFYGVFVAELPHNDRYQRLPDTLRFSQGEFVSDLVP